MQKLFTMAWGILDDPKMENVPGTQLLQDRSLNLDVTDSTSHLKHRDGVILIPQPSESPNDPLNWSNRRKNFILGMLAIALVTTGTSVGIIGAALKWLLVDFKIDYAHFLREVSMPRMAVSAVVFFFASAIAAVYGKRVQFVICGFVIVGIQIAGFWYNSIAYLSILSTLR